MACMEGISKGQGRRRFSSPPPPSPFFAPVTQTIITDADKDSRYNVHTLLSKCYKFFVLNKRFIIS